MEFLEIPFLPDDVIGEKARSFLEEIGRLDTLPIDSEAIVEFDLGLDIIPIPGLQQEIGTEAFLSSNLRGISVDQFILENRPNRYRFSLAHELGHLKLHSDIYAKSRFNNFQECKEWHNQLSNDDRFWLETHANSFAGHFLVPTAHLRKKFFDMLAEARQKIRQCTEIGFSKEEALDNTIIWISQMICPHFQVSSQVVKIRLERENLKEHLRR